MTVSIVALLRIIAGRVTVDAPLVHRPFLVPLVAIVGGLVLSAIDMANARTPVTRPNATDAEAAWDSVYSVLTSPRKARYEHPAFCLILDGSCFLDADEVGMLELQEGDFAFLPAMPGFTLASDLDIKPRLVPFDHSRATHYGAKSGPETMRMLGGYFRFDRANAQLLVRLLPPVVHIRRDEEGAARVRRVVELIGEEADTDRPGRDLILEHLVQALLVEALRFQPASVARESQGLLAGLCDPALARALRDMHVDVARRWTVAELARTAYMSRAVFVEHFAQKVGMPPMQYLLEWRMAIAKDMLRRNGPPLAEVAEKVGYQSASAFSTAFTRLTGCSPGVFARSTD